MSLEITLVLLILAAAVALFVTQKIGVDLVALLVLVVLAVLGLVSHEQAIAGFSNPAVVTIGAMLVLSAGLARSGAASIACNFLLRFVGRSELGVLTLLMLVSGLTSSIMFNVGVVALLLPLVPAISRRVRQPPSKLLIPMSFAALLGGLVTLIGSSPNILISATLAEAGLPPFRLLDFAPLGLATLSVGVVYMLLVGRRLLPERDVTREARAVAGMAAPPDIGEEVTEMYELKQRASTLSVPEDSLLSGKTLRECRLGSALGLTVLSIDRPGRTVRAPGPDAVLRSGDKLVVEGRVDVLEALQAWEPVLMDTPNPDVEELLAAALGTAEARVPEGSPLAGKTVLECDLRRRFGVELLAARSDGEVRQQHLGNVRFEPDMRLLLQGTQVQVAQLATRADLADVQPLERDEAFERFGLRHRLMGLQVSSGSLLEGRMLAEARFGLAFDLTLLGILREGGDGSVSLVSELGEEILATDILLVQGHPEELFTLYALRELEAEKQAPATALEELESETVGMAEVTLSPRSELSGSTVRDLYFRDRYGLTVLAIWRQGEAYTANIGDIQLQLGDALLVYGERDRIAQLARDPDFLVLTDIFVEEYRLEKAPVAALIQAAVLAAIILGWLPVATAALSGAAFMVLTGCLTMEEAYRAVDWRTILLVAGMLVLGTAMQESGAAALLARTGTDVIGEWGPRAIVGAIFVGTAVAAQVLPTSVAAVLMSPVALSVAAAEGLSPHALAMSVALACASSLVTPVGHAANLMVMGLGGYRFTDYTRVGLPLVVLMLLVALLVLPWLWPLAA